jgi:hypothetical protein
MTFSGYGKRSEMILLVEGDYPRTKVKELLRITKLHYPVDNIKKLMPILGYIDKTLFEKRYERIAHLIRIPINILMVKALMHF